jgi:hypothetical protein
MPLSMQNQWVSIANRALARIGTQSISSLDEGSTASKYCSSLLPEAVQSVYGQYDWRSARKRIELAPLTELPIYDWSYAYQLPVDFARLLSVDSENEYSLEGQTILSNDEEMSITYIAYPVEATFIPGYISHLLVTFLAFLLSTPLVSNETMAQRLLQEYQTALERAKVDDNAGVYETPPEAFYEDAR